MYATVYLLPRAALETHVYACAGISPDGKARAVLATGYGSQRRIVSRELDYTPASPDVCEAEALILAAEHGYTPSSQPVTHGR